MTRPYSLVGASSRCDTPLEHFVGIIASERDEPAVYVTPLGSISPPRADLVHTEEPAIEPVGDREISLQFGPRSTLDLLFHPSTSSPSQNGELTRNVTELWILSSTVVPPISATSRR